MNKAVEGQGMAVKRRQRKVQERQYLTGTGEAAAGMIATVSRAPLAGGRLAWT